MAKIKSNKLNQIPHYNEFKKKQDEKEEAAKSASTSKQSDSSKSKSETKTEAKKPTIKQSKLNSIPHYNEYKAKKSGKDSTSTQSGSRRGFNDIYNDMSAAEERVKGYQSSLDTWLSKYGANSDNVMDKLATKYGARRDESGTYLFSDQSSLDEFNRVMDELSTLYDQYNTGVNAYNDLFDLANTYDIKAATVELEELKKQLEQAERERDQASLAFSNTARYAAPDVVTRLSQDLKAKEDRYYELSQQVAALNRDIYNAQHYQDSAMYNEYMNAEDFDKLNGTVRPGESEYMTEDELHLYNYLLMKKGHDTANAYYEHLEEARNYRKGVERGEEIRGIENDLGRFLATGAHGAWSGLSNFGRGVKQLFTDEMLTTSPTQYADAYILEDLQKNGTKIPGMDKTWGEMGYEGASIVSNMAPTILVTAVTGGLGAPAAVASAAGAATMGLSAAGNAYTQALGEGYTKGQAKNYAIAVGASEGALQYILGGVGKLAAPGGVSGKLLTKVASIDNGLLRAAAAAGVKGGSEIAEEELQNYLEPLYRTLIFGEEYDAPTVEDIVYTAVLTFFTTGVMEVGDIVSYAKNKPAALNAEAALPETLEQAALEAVMSETEAQEAVQQPLGSPVSEVMREADTTEPQQRSAPVARSMPVAEQVASETVTAPAQQQNEQTELLKPHYGESGMKTFNAILKANPGADQNQMVLHFDTPYQAGLTGLPVKEAKLANDFQIAAFNAGRRDYIARMTQDEQHTPVAILSEEASGFDTTGIPKDVSQQYKDFTNWFAKRLGVAAGVDGDPGTADGSAYNAFFDPESKTADVRFAPDFGIDPELMAALGSTDFMEKVDRLAAGREEDFIFYVAHEMAGHVAADRAPQQMRSFFNGMYNYLQKTGEIGNAAREKQVDYDAGGKDLDTVAAIEEVGSDSVLRLYNNNPQEFMEAMHRVYESLDEDGKEGARTFGKILSDIIEKLKAWVRKLTGKENAAARARVEKGITELEKLRNEFEEGIAEAMRRVERARKSNNAVISEVKSGLGEGAAVQTNKDGDLLLAKSKDGSKLVYSYKTFQNGGKEKLRIALQRNGHTKEEIDSTLDLIEDAADYLKILAAGYAKSHNYTALSDHLIADITTNLKTGKQVMSALVNNGDYPVNIDLALICKKRVAYMNLMTRLIEDGIFDLVNYKGEAIADVNDILRANNFETACLGCFVESRRLQFQAWAETIVSEWNDEVSKRNKNPKAFGFASKNYATLTDAEMDALARELEGAGKKNKQGNLNLGKGSVKDKIGRLLDKVPSLQQTITTADLLTPAGLAALRAYDSNLFSIVKSRYGAASPKIVQDFNPYASEIAMMTFKSVSDITSNAVKGAQDYIKQAKKDAGGTPKKQAGESVPAFKKRKAEWNARVETEAMRNYLYDIGGARCQSFSDFMIENVFDYLQIFADLAANEFPLHGYTKEIICLRLFGMSGAKWNGSLIAHTERSMGKEFAGLLPASAAKDGSAILVHTEDGDYAIGFDDYARNKATEGKSFIQSIGMKDIIALQLDPRYSANVGSITIGVSDKQILAMLDSPLFSMVIPYHASGMLPGFAQRVGVDMYNDYTDYQNTTVKQLFDAEGNRVESLVDSKGKTIKVDTSYAYNAEVQKTGDAREAANNYVKWCTQRHPVYDGKTLVGYATFNPKFSDSPYGTDFSRHPNYYKLLEDFNSYDGVTGVSAVQGPVTMTFPSEENRLSASEMEAYKQRLRDTGIFTEKDIAKYEKQANKTFKELIADEVKGRAEYKVTQDAKWEKTVSEIKDKLMTDHRRFSIKSGQKITEASARGALYDVMDHADAGDDNLVLLGAMPKYIQDISGISGDLHLFRNHAYENMVTEERAKADGRLAATEKGRRNQHFHNIGEDAMVQAILALENPLITIADQGTFGNPALSMVLPVYDEQNNPIHAVVGFYANEPVNGVYKKRPHIAVTFYGHPYEFEGDSGHKTITDVVNEAITGKKILDFDRKKLRADLPVIAQDTTLGNVTASALKQNVAQFQKDVKGFKAKNKINYSLKTTRGDGGYAPTFYSKMEQVVQNTKQEKLGAASVVSMLKGKGVKDEEIKWSGIQTWLEGKKSVTKQELLDFIRSNDVVIEETILDDGTVSNGRIAVSKEDQSRMQSIDDGIATNFEAIKDWWREDFGEDLGVDNPLNFLMRGGVDESLREVAWERFSAARSKALGPAADVIEAHNGFGNMSRKEIEEMLVGIGEYNYPVAASMKYLEIMDRQGGKNYAALSDSEIETIEKFFEVTGKGTLGYSVTPAKYGEMRTAESAMKDFRRDRRNVMNKYDDLEYERRTKWKSYKIPGGDNYRELLFKIPGVGYSNNAMTVHWGEDVSGVLAHARIQDIETDSGKMLFVEEIQSDWHNEGHKNGYADGISATNLDELRDNVDLTRSAVSDAYTTFKSVEGKYTALLTDFGRISNDNEAWQKDVQAAIEEVKAAEEAHAMARTAYVAAANKLHDAVSKGNVPDAPFRKNYHEFVLKSLLRMAAEEGYDSISWTTGKQQEDRWSSEFAEGYRIEYDQDIPKFLSKYGKQWGANVGKTTIGKRSHKFDIDSNTSMDDDAWLLDDGIDFDGEEVWSMPVTSAMKQSVLYEGQPMFSLKSSSATRKQIERIREEGAKAGKSEAEINKEIADVVSPQHAALLKAYGEIKRGENPIREIKVPKRSDEDKKISQTVRTILEARATPNSALPKIQEMIVSGDFSYDVYTDEAAINLAESIISDKGYGVALAEWIKDVESGKVNKTNTALGWALYNAAAANEDFETAMTILNYMVGHQRNAAQAVQATRILKKLEPDAQLYGAVKSVQKLEEDLNEGKRVDGEVAKRAAGAVGKAKQAAVDAAADAHTGVKVKRRGRRVVIDSNQAGEPFVFEYAQKVGEALAKGLEAKRNRPAKEKTFLQQIVAELNRFASEKLPKEKKGTSLTAIDLLRDYIQNQSFYAEAWQAAQIELREKYVNDPVLSEFINTGIGVDANTNPQNAIFMRALVKAAADSGEGKAVLRRQEALGFTGMADTIADNLIQQTGATGEMADTIRDAAHAYVYEAVSETQGDNIKLIDSAIRGAMKDIGIKIGDVVMNGTGETAQQQIIEKLVGKYGFGLAEATRTAEVVAERFNAMSKKYAENRLKSMFKARSKARKSIPEKIEALARLGAFDVGSAYNQQAAERIFKVGTPLTINEELAAKFLKAETQEERDEILADIYRDVGRQIPASFVDKWNAWRYLAMLGNPRTHVRNVVGNLGFAPVVLAKDATATVIESAVSFVTGGKISRTKGLPNRKLLKAAWADYENAAAEIMAGGKYSDAAIKNQHIEEGRVIYKFKPLEKARKGNSAAMEAEDSWFSRPHYAFALAQYCKAHGVTVDQLRRGKALGNARAYAIKEAQKATYRDTNEFSEFVSKVGRYHGDNKVAKGASVVVEGIIPFRKTPANILVRGIEYSPMGLLKGLAYDLYKVKKGDLMAAEAIDHIAAGLTGTGLLGLGLWAAAEGLIRGAGGGDDDEKTFEELQGHQAYALELPDGTSVTLDWLAPEVLPLFIGANIYEMASENKGKTSLSDILTAVSNVTEPLLEMSCLQSLNDLFDSMGYASNNGLDALPSALASAATSYLTQAFPTILGQTERSSQGERMTTYTEKNGFLTSDMQYTLGKISAKIPGWDFQQIPYIDAWGRTESTGGNVENAANNFFNPAYMSQIDTSAMEEELQRLYDATGEKGVLPDRAPKYFTVDSERKDLTAEEYVGYATERGQLSYDMLSEITTLPEYAQMTDAEKVDTVEMVFEYADAVAKTGISDYKPTGWVAKAIEADKSCDMDEMDYILYKMALSMVDQPNKNGELGGTPTQAEQAMAIDLRDDLSDKDIAYLWDTKDGYAAYDAGVDMRAYVNKLADGTEVNVEKLIGAKDVGMSDEDYYDFLDALTEYDQPTENGKYGTFTQDEASAAIASIPGLTRAQRSYLWQSMNKSWKSKNNPWR